METHVDKRIASVLTGFRLPRYHEIPDVGLYLEQVTKYISDCLSPIANVVITGSMISNYVKRDLIPNPVRKQYNREHIAWLIYIAVLKNVVSIDDLRLMLDVQKETYPTGIAYNYFCSEFENLLEYVFGRKSEIEKVGVENTGEKTMLRNAIITVVHKIYLDQLFAVLRKERNS